MPGGDGTGPDGLGGWCTPFWARGQTQMTIGVGRVFRGRGRGCRNMFLPTGLPGWIRDPQTQQPTKEQEILLLEEHLKNVDGHVRQVQRRIGELKGE